MLRRVESCPSRRGGAAAEEAATTMLAYCAVGREEELRCLPLPRPSEAVTSEGEKPVKPANQPARLRQAGG